MKKKKYGEEKLAELYRYLCDVEVPKQKKFAVGMASVFGINYVCEQDFSRSTHRTKLTDEYLKTNILIGCSNSKPNIDYILKGKLQIHDRAAILDN